MSEYRDLDRRAVVDDTELKMLRRMQRLVDEFMVECEDVIRDGEVPSEGAWEILEQLWDENRDYNEYMGPGGAEVM